MRYRKVFFLFLVSLCSFRFLLDEASADNLSCLICHDALKGKYVTRFGVPSSLHVDGKKFTASVHGDLECTFCHLHYVDNPHRDRDEGVPEEITETAKAIAMKKRASPCSTDSVQRSSSVTTKAFMGKNIILVGKTSPSVQPAMGPMPSEAIGTHRQWSSG